MLNLGDSTLTVTYVFAFFHKPMKYNNKLFSAHQ